MDEPCHSVALLMSDTRRKISAMESGLTQIRRLDPASIQIDLVIMTLKSQRLDLFRQLHSPSAVKVTLNIHKSRSGYSCYLAHQVTNQ